MYLGRLFAASCALSLSMATGQDLESTIAKVTAAVGNLTGLETFSVQGSGEVWINFEAELPDEVVALSAYDVDYSFDLVEDWSRVDMFSTHFFEVFQFFPPSSSSRVVRGDAGYVLEPNLFVANGTMSAILTGSLKRNLMYQFPHIVLRAALLSDSIMVSYEMIDSMDVLRVASPVTDLLYHIDPVSGTISKLTTMESDPLVRDIPIEVTYSDWSLESNGISFPAKMEMFALESKLKIWDETRTSVQTGLNFPDGHFDVPADADTTVNSDELLYGMQAHHIAEGFFHLGFGTWMDVPYSEQTVLAPGVFLYFNNFCNSIIIQSEAGVVVLEAGGNELIGGQLVDIVQGFSGDSSPVTHLVQSHHHVDHASGVRTLVGATGANLVVGHGVKEFWESAFMATSDIRPDILSDQLPLSPTVEELAFLGSLQIVESSTHNVTVYHTDKDPHAEDSIFVEVKTNGQIIIFMTDMYNAGVGLTAVVGGPEGLFTSLVDVGILDCACDSVSGESVTIVPGHGRPLALEDAKAELAGLEVPTGCQPATCKDILDGDDDDDDDGDDDDDDDDDDSGSTAIMLSKLASLALGLAAIIAY